MSQESRKAGIKAGIELAHAMEEYPDHFESLDSTSTLGKCAPYIIIAYLIIGSAFYSFVEGWEWHDALYFSVVTMTTVGYGDLSPSSDLSKAFTIGYILMGLSLVATCLGVLIGEVQGAAEASQAAKAKAAAKAGREAVAAFNRQRHIATVVGSLVTVVGLLSLGAALVSYSEGWGALDSFYWAVVTVSSVGYGDLVVDEDHTATIVFATAYMLVAVGGCAVALGNFGSVIMEIESDAKVDRFVARGVTEGMISEMDDEKCGSVGRAQFLAYMLVAMGKVEQKDCDKVNAMFDALDADGSGSLDLEDVRAFNERRRSHSLTKSKPNPSAAVEYSKRRSTFGSGSSFGQLQKPLLDAA